MANEGFDVSLSRHLMTGLVHYTRPVWRWLGRLETRAVRDEIDEIEVDTPVYIAGLARAGSTILLRAVASCPGVVTHQYQDFPFLYIPFWWQQTLERQHRGKLEPSERAHEDRLEVTPESPEAMEEVLWMAFFGELHDPSTSNVLGRETTNSDFEDFYRNHVRKLLRARGGGRYAAKGNYNVTRLAYLREIFPDAKFIVPVRRPRDHIASSQKQQRLFSEGAEEHPRAVSHLKRVGHFEFGPHRRPVNAGDDEAVEAIQRAWREGRELEGWARYWAHIYGFVADLLESDSDLSEAVRLVRYEDLCGETRNELDSLLAHADLRDGADSVVDRYTDEITAPDYYETEYDAQEESLIDEMTADVAARYGYEEGEVADDVPLRDRPGVTGESGADDEGDEGT